MGTRKNYPLNVNLVGQDIGLKFIHKDSEENAALIGNNRHVCPNYVLKGHCRSCLQQQLINFS